MSALEEESVKVRGEELGVSKVAFWRRFGGEAPRARRKASTGGRFTSSITQPLPSDFKQHGWFHADGTNDLVPPSSRRQYFSDSPAQWESPGISWICRF